MYHRSPPLLKAYGKYPGTNGSTGMPYCIPPSIGPINLIQQSSRNTPRASRHYQPCSPLSFNSPFHLSWPNLSVTDNIGYIILRWPASILPPNLLLWKPPATTPNATHPVTGFKMVASLSNPALPFSPICSYPGVK